MTEFKEKMKSIQFLSKTPQSAIEQRWEKDLPAYRRLRKQGLQPKGIDGCAVAETKAKDRFEIDYGHLAASDQERKLFREAIERGRELQLGE